MTASDVFFARGQELFRAAVVQIRVERLLDRTRDGRSPGAPARRARRGGRAPFPMSVAERLLIARLRDRDEQAFNEVVRIHGERVYNLVFRMVGNRAEAEDVAQEVFVTLFKTIDTFREESRFSTWLLRIASNHCKNRWKVASRARTDGREMDHDRDQHLSDVGRAPAHHVHPPDQMLEAAQLDRWMQQAIDTLDEEQRLILILRDVEELTYEEITEVTGLAEGTIKSRLHRARMIIKEFLAKNMR